MFKHHKKLERNSIYLLIGTILVISIGGLVEIVPLFRIETTIEKVSVFVRSRRWNSPVSKFICARIARPAIASRFVRCVMRSSATAIIHWRPKA